MSNSSIASTDLKSNLGEGGSHLNDNLREVLAALANGAKNRVARGLLVAAPTTASTQAAGTGATAWRVNVATGVVIVSGIAKEFPAEADRVLNSGTQLVTNGQSAVCAIVAKNVSGAVTLVNVMGAAAATGSQKAPDDVAIRAAVGADNAWVKVAECTLNRTGDTTVTQSQDNTAAGLGDYINIK